MEKEFDRQTVYVTHSIADYEYVSSSSQSAVTVYYTKRAIKYDLKANL